MARTGMRPLITLVSFGLLAGACAHLGSFSRHEVALPVALNTTRLIDSDTVVVISHDAVKNVDIIQVGASVVEPPNLRKAFHDVFHEARSTDIERSIIIEAAPDVRYQTVITVTDAAKTAGFFIFGLANRVRGERDHHGVLAGFEKDLGPPTGGPPIDIFVVRTKVKNAIKVRVTKADHVWIDGKPSRGANLYASIAAAIARHQSHGNSTHISLLVDKDASWEHVIQIMDAARQAGDDDIGFVGVR